MEAKKTITIIGGGSSAHTLIPLLSKTGFEINLLTRKPELWSNNLELHYQNVDGEILNTFNGKIDTISKNPEDAIPDSDIVILCMPVSKYRIALDNIAPYINKNKDVFVGAVYGQAGFNWMVDEIKKNYELENVITFAFGLIPWICRIIEYGKIGVTYGSKEVNVAAVYPKEHFDYLNNILFEKICFDWFNTGKFLQSSNFLSLTLSVDNQIIHPSRCYGLYLASDGDWDSEEQVPLFYRHYDDLSSDLLKELDDDYSKIRNWIIDKNKHMDFSYMLDYLSLEQLSYNSSNTDIKESFITSKTLGAIKTPVVLNLNGKYEINSDNRFFTDDINYGLCIAKWIAQEINIEVPMIDKIIHWAQKVRNEKLIDVDNKLILNSPDLKDKFKSGIPIFYDLKTMEDILG